MKKINLFWLKRLTFLYDAPMSRHHVLVLTLMVALPLTAQEWALERLEESPRHHQWVDIETSVRTIRAFVVYPEVSEKVPVVIVIHENRGLNDWARSLADQVAEAGYIAVAPDLLTGMAPEGGNSAEFETTNAARDAIYDLDDDAVLTELGEIVDWAGSIDASSGTVVAAGFCWGGRKAFQLATRSTGLSAVFVFYGTAPEADSMGSIRVPVYGFYGENDARVTSTVASTRVEMEKAGAVFIPVVYAGAGHGFMRSGEQPDAEAANVAARSEAWKRWKRLLATLE